MIDNAAVVKLIGSTSMPKGLKVICSVEKKIYPTEVKVDEDQLDAIDIEFKGSNKG